ncbi:DUF2812 domain-containing protein [Paraclostridium bifermentans]|uniref:DUF2812 domain-containing protein n=1 Tax=Paraclostridium bifermentans TaxID=1490 RepID=UPI00359C5D7D
MKYKYVMIGGVAFSEEADMEKLSNYAKQGWILEGIKGGFFYKLRKDEPQDIIYSLDYQSDANEEYLSIFEEAGWEHVVSSGNVIHIFSAKAGTKPIYSDCESELSKYITIRDKSKKGSLYSLILSIILTGMLVLSGFFMRQIFLIIVAVWFIDIVVFIFNFMPYLAYNNRIKEMKKGGKYNKREVSNRMNWKVNAFIATMLLISGIVNLNKNIFVFILYLIAGTAFAFSSVSFYKQYKKSSKH